MIVSVKVAYPTLPSQQLDDRLERLAAKHGGRWSGSGVGFHEAIAERDIEFDFDSQADAEGFARTCATIDGVRVLSITPEEEPI